MYQTILFDFDGTLFETGAGIIKCIRLAMDALGYNTDGVQLRGFVGPPLKKTLAEDHGVGGEAADAIIAEYRRHYADWGILDCSPYPGIIELVQSLREAGRKVAVATGKPTVYTKRILHAHGLDNLFDEVLGSELDGTRSEKWQVIETLLKKYGREGVVMIGDRDNDVLGAKTCDIPCIGVSWGYAAPGELESAGAICVADSVAELKKILMGGHQSN